MSLKPPQVSQVRSFLEMYLAELSKKKKSNSSGGTTNSSSRPNSFNVPDPTTANALNTSTVVILRKKSSNLKNSPFDGIPLYNYRLRPKDVQPEVFDWVSHFLWLKNCPLHLSTIVATHIANKMSDEIAFKFASPEIDDLSPSLDGAGNVADTSDIKDVLDNATQRPFPPALCSVDVAKQSREMVDEYLEELGSNPDNAVQLVNDYLDGSKSPNGAPATTPFISSLYATKNGRVTMEDRHVIIHDLNKALNLNIDKSYSYYAIFDGHAGVDAATYSTAHLHHYLVETEAFSEGRIEEAFQKAFEITDSKYVQRCKEDGVDKLRPGGTTALCALIENNKTVYLAWVGDSQAVLVRNGCHEEIMLPHKPDLESERVRIRDLGGLIVFMDTWRVNGVLSVSRAIGDPEHKPYIIAEPSLAKFEIDSTLDFLVLGCDGLFDQLTSQDIASHVFEYLCTNHNRDPQEVMNEVSVYLSKMAISEGSVDNITSIVLFFKPFDQLIATGYPTLDDSQTQVDNVSACDFAPVASLPVTNGGHFPYTDFSELPIGTSYKLNSEVEQNLIENPTETIVESSFVTSQESSNEQTVTNPFAEDQAIDQQVNVTSIEADSSVQIDPFEFQHAENVLIPEDQLSTQSEQDSFDLNSTTANEFVYCKTDQISEDSSEQHFFTKNCQNPFTSGNLMMDEPVKLNGHANVPDNNIVPIEESINVNSTEGESDVFVKPLTPTNATSEQFIEDLNISSRDVSQIMDKTLTSESTQNESNQNDSNYTQHLNDESVPQIISHPSDSGYCYTNSISEFSTSFPNENKIEDNFCSTPIQLVQNETDKVSESGLVDTQSSINEPSQNNDSHVSFDNPIEVNVSDDQVVDLKMSENSQLIDNLEESENKFTEIVPESISKSNEDFQEQPSTNYPVDIDQSVNHLPNSNIEICESHFDFKENTLHDNTNLIDDLVNTEPMPISENITSDLIQIDQSELINVDENIDEIESNVDDENNLQTISENINLLGSLSNDVVADKALLSEAVLDKELESDLLTSGKIETDIVLQSYEQLDVFPQTNQSSDKIEEANLLELDVVPNIEDKIEFKLPEVLETSNGEVEDKIQENLEGKIHESLKEKIQENLEDKIQENLEKVTEPTIDFKDEFNSLNVLEQNVDKVEVENNLPAIPEPNVAEVEEAKIEFTEADIPQNELSNDKTEETKLSEMFIQPNVEIQAEDVSKEVLETINGDVGEKEDLVEISEPKVDLKEDLKISENFAEPIVDEVKEKIEDESNIPILNGDKIESEVKLASEEKPSEIQQKDTLKNKVSSSTINSLTSKKSLTKLAPVKPKSSLSKTVPATSSRIAPVSKLSTTRVSTALKPKPTTTVATSRAPVTRTSTSTTSRLTSSSTAKAPTTSSSINKVNGTAAKVPSTRKPLYTAPTRPTTSTISTTRTTKTTTTSVSRLALSRPSGTATTSSSQLKTSVSNESKPSVTRRSLPTTVKQPTTTASRTAKTSLPSATSRTSTVKPSAPSKPLVPRTNPSVSKIGSLRPSTLNKTSSASSKPSAPKPVNGTNEIKAVRKPPMTNTQNKTVLPNNTPALNGNSSTMTKSSTFTPKRGNLIGVENSLKQELEDAQMNELNGGNNTVKNGDDIDVKQ